jgi:PAS domain S-box-containing protein
MRRLSFLISLILLLFTAIQADAARGKDVTFAPGAHLRVEHLTIDDGLSQNAGLALLQDSQGYLWIGTQDGLNRYDGYTITQFKHDADNPNSLSHNSIIALYEDRDGYLWIGTWGGGLNRYDPATQQFTRYTPDPANPNSLTHPIVTDIIQDEQGVYWVATLGGLERFDPATETFTHFHHDPADPNSLSSDILSVILPADDGKLWVGTGAFSTPGSGLNLFDPVSGEAQRLKKSGDCLASANIADLLPAPDDGALWIAYGGYGVAGGGLDRYNPQTGDCLHFDNAQTFGDQITDDNFTDLAFDQDGALWITSWSGGLWRMALDGQFIGIHHNPSDPDSLSSDNTFTVLPDRSGVIWVGTLSAGVNKLNLDTLMFRTYRHDASNPKSLPNNHVSSFTETGDGIIWIGTSGDGLVRFDPSNGEFTHYRSDPANPASISGDMVLTLFADSDDTLWVGTFGSGLNHFDPRTGLFTRYQNDPAVPNSLLENQVTNIIRDSAGRLWVSSFAGLSRLDPGAVGFVNYPMPAPPVSFGLVGNELWVGTWGGGLYRLDLSDPASLDPAKAAFTTLKNDPANSNSLSSNDIWTILQTPDDLVWLGTIAGLNRYDPQTGQFKIYTEKNGLPNASIMGILRDQHGFLWLTTNHGMVRFDTQTETFQVYEKSDGLQGNEFNSNAYFKASNGDFYVGGVSGFSIFDPLNLRQNELPPPVVITDFSVFNTPQPFNPAETIRLNYDQNFISFEFAALDYHDPRSNQYAYKLEGFDKDWVQAGSRNYASYTNLPGGEYTFHVRAANSDGVWNETGAALHLIVTPPIWQTWPFWWGLFLGGVSLVVAGFQWRVRAVRQQNIQLQQMVDEQKMAEIKLRESEARFRAMYENAAIGISLIAPDGHVLSVNPMLSKLAGRSESELIELGGQGITYPEDNDVGRHEFLEVIAGVRDSYQVEKRYVHKDGRIQWMRQSISAVRQTNGKLHYLVVIAEDIDERKRAVEELRQSEARFKAIFENSAVGMGLMSLDRIVLDSNPAMCAMLGYTREELIGRDPARVTHPDDFPASTESFKKLLSGEDTHYVAERRYVRKNGEVFWTQISMSLVRDPQGKPLYLVGLINDIDVQKRAAEKLAAQEAGHRQQLEQRISERTEELNLANERLREKAAQDAVTAERTRLARDLHDAVTQTLFSTTLIADVLPEIWAMNPDEGRRRLEEVRQLTRGALAEMRTLLVELRPNALVEVPLPTLLRQLTEALTGRSRMNIELSAEGEFKLPPDVQVGLYRLAQEALNNVVKHAKASQAVVTLRCSEETTRLTVADNGIGFDPSTVTADHLGLKIMRERAEAIGAKLSLYSESGEGTQISAVLESKPLNHECS